MATLHGKVQNSENDISNVLVINLSTNKSTITDIEGLFILPVKLGDSIQFSAVQYIPKQIIVTNSILDKRKILVDLEEKVINLDEVLVTPYNLTGNIDRDIERLNIKPLVTSSTLGLPNADLELMTQSERMLLEADRGKYVRLQTIEDYGKTMEILGYATFSIIINTHKIMNKLSGRTQNLKNRVLRDENLNSENDIVTLFSKKIISEELGIPLENVDGFLTFCLSQPDFHTLRETENINQIWTYLKTKSHEFKIAN